MAKSRKRAAPAKRDQMQSAAMDAFSNPAARIGFGTMDLLQATDYPLTRLSQNYQLLTSLYRDNWIVQNIVGTIPDDMIRKWYEINSGIAPDYIDELRKLERKTQLRKRLQMGMYWGRLYGGAVGVILIKGHEDLSQPLEIGAIMPGAFLGLQILDRWSGVFPEGDLVKDPENPDFGLPEYYTMRDDENGQIMVRVHHSRVVRFIGRELPWLEQVTENYWGESEIESVYNEVTKRDNVSGNIAALTFRANINYLEAEGLDMLLGIGNSEMQRRFWNTLQAQAIMESNFGTRVINKGDQMHNVQYTFTGLADVYDRIMMDVAGAARTPVTKLFGRSPAGMNATGESDMQNYYDYIDGLRETMLRNVIERLLPVMAMSAWGMIPDDLQIDFPPMSTPDAREVAEIAERKAGAIVAVYQNDLIDASTAMQELQTLEPDTGLFGKITDEAIENAKGQTYTSSKLMPDPFAGITTAVEEESEDEEWQS